MMEPLSALDDVEIQEKVESLVGKGTRVVDCEKSTSFQTEEVLLVNGFPVPLVGEQGARIKAALLSGQVPPGDLLNEILMKAGILKNPVELEATCNVKTTTKTTEVMTLRDGSGTLLDERMKEVEEDNEFQSTSKEVWRKDLPGLGDSLAKISLSSTSTSGSVNGSPRHSFGGSRLGTPASFLQRSSSPANGSSSSRLSTPPPQPPPLIVATGIGGACGTSNGGISNGHQHSPQSSTSSSGISEGSGSSSRSESSASSLSSRFSVSYGKS